MDIEYYGANRIVLSNKKHKIVVDDYADVYGAKPISDKNTLISINSNKDYPINTSAKHVINGAGEYEIEEITIKGWQTNAMAEGKKSTVYALHIEDYAVVIVGYADPALNQEVYDGIEDVDLLIIAVGGFGMTMEAKDAAKIIKTLEPKAVMLTHYSPSNLKYPVVSAEVSAIEKDLATTVAELSSLKLKDITSEMVDKFFVLKEK